MFVCGSKEGLMTVSGRRHNTDDIIATVLAVEPMKFIYRGRLDISFKTNENILLLMLRIHKMCTGNFMTLLFPE